MIDLKKISKKSSVGKKRISATLSEELYNEFSSICRKERVKKNELLRELIFKFCEDYKKNETSIN